MASTLLVDVVDMLAASVLVDNVPIEAHGRIVLRIVKLQAAWIPISIYYERVGMINSPWKSFMVSLPSPAEMRVQRVM